MSKNITNTRYLAKLIERTQVAENTHRFLFKTTPKLKFKPGQYIWLILPKLIAPDDSGDRRAMSIINRVNRNGEVEILTRTSASGFKKTLDGLALEDEVWIEGPFGHSFVLPQPRSTPLVLIGGGVGIAPFLGLAQQASRKGKGKQCQIELVLMNDSDKRTPSLSEISKLSESNVKVNSEKGEPSREKLERYAKIPGALFYISGPQGMVDGCSRSLRELGVPEKRMRFEQFYPTKPDIAQLHSFFDKSGALRSAKDEASYNRQRRNILQLAIESTSHHIVITDTNGEIVYANRAATSITGYSFDEMKGNTPRLWGGLMSGEFYRDLWASKLHGKTVDTELVNRKKDGTLYHVLAHIAPILNERDEVLGFIGTEEDITRIRDSEKNNKQQKERFEQLVNSIPEVYWICSTKPTRDLLYVSPAFRSIWGVSPEEVVKNPKLWMSRIHPDDQPKVEEAYSRFISGEAGFSIEYRVHKRNGKELWVHDVGELVTNRSGAAERAVGVVRDITSERSIDEEKTEFVSLASHQLKTPISAVKWNAEMLLDGEFGKLKPKQKIAIEEMYRMNVRMRDLVNGLLDISRIDMGTFAVSPEPTNLSEEVDSVLAELNPQIKERDLGVATHYSKKLASIPIDKKLIRAVLTNLLLNACTYTPHGGNVSIRIRPKGKNVQIEVSNNGDPIPESDQPMIFKKMFRASNAQEQNPNGNGLGLYLVKVILENCGGKIWFESTPKIDTTFTVSLPLSGMVGRD